MLSHQVDSLQLTQYLPSSPFRDVNQFFDDLPQNVMLIGTAMAICGVVYSILTLSVYLFIQNVVLSAATYHAYKQLCEAACMQENLSRLESTNKDLRSTVDEMAEHEVNIGQGVFTLGTLQGQLEELRAQIAEEKKKLQQANTQYESLNTQNASILAKHEEAANKLYGSSSMV